MRSSIRQKQVWLGVALVMPVIVGIWVLQLKQSVGEIDTRVLPEEVLGEWGAAKIDARAALRELERSAAVEGWPGEPSPTTPNGATDLEAKAVEILVEKLKGEEKITEE